MKRWRGALPRALFGTDETSAPARKKLVMKYFINFFLLIPILIACSNSKYPLAGHPAIYRDLRKKAPNTRIQNQIFLAKYKYGKTGGKVLLGTLATPAIIIGSINGSIAAIPYLIPAAENLYISTRLTPAMIEYVGLRFPNTISFLLGVGEGYAGIAAGYGTQFGQTIGNSITVLEYYWNDTFNSDKTNSNK